MDPDPHGSAFNFPPGSGFRTRNADPDLGAISWKKKTHQKKGMDIVNNFNFNYNFKGIVSRDYGEHYFSLF